MGLGEIPGGNLTLYYKLENANDSSGRGINLSTSGTVNFVSGRYSNCADFGNSGTANGLYYSSNPFPTATPDQVYISFWFKLNSTANTSRNHVFFTINTVTSDTSGRQYLCLYTISGGNITIIGRRPSGASNNEVTITFTANSEWHFVLFRYDGVNDVFTVTVFNNDLSIVGTDTNNSTATGVSAISSPTVFFTIGNGRNLVTSAFSLIDELIISESLYVSNSTEQHNRIKYRMQAKGFLVMN